MSSINSVTILGRLGRDPEVRSTGSGTAVANFSVATSEKWKDKNSGQSQEKTTWHKVAVFGRLAEVVGEYARKGDQIAIQGKLENRQWEDKDGNKRESVEILAQNITFLGSKSSGQREQAGFDDEVPF